MPDTGPVAEIDALLAAFVSGPRAATLAGSVHLHCTDGDGEWMIERDDAGTVVLARRHAKGDCAIRGTAAALLALVRGSGSTAGLEVLGETGVAEGFAFALGMD